MAFSGGFMLDMSRYGGGRSSFGHTSGVMNATVLLDPERRVSLALILNGFLGSEQAVVEARRPVITDLLQIVDRSYPDA
jgi:hypothetical protein